MFGKYQLVRILGKGRSGTVYLAVHMELKEYRAIKQVKRSSAGYERFRKEAFFLTKLRHPGIPIVYDLEEDFDHPCEGYGYLIEEYLEGDTLYDLVRNQGHLNQEAVIHIGIQICDLVHYLHSAGETPILYLDLQPKNLLYCHGHVKLLDFDHAEWLHEANQASLRYGTPGFYAPEQEGEGVLGIYTDIYQIGALLYYLLTGRMKDNADREPTAGALGRMIDICTQCEGADRYQSVMELKQELEYLQSKSGVFKEYQSSSLIIALVGSRHGVGTTHLAIGLTRYLNQLGFETLYEEHNSSGDVQRTALHCGSFPDSYGIYIVRGIPMKPQYGEAVCLKPVKYPLIVRDYGTDWKTVRNETGLAALWLVQGGKWWQQEEGIKAVRTLRDCPLLTVLYNETVQGMMLDKPEGVNPDKCYEIPWYDDPWISGRNIDSCFQELLQTIQLPEGETADADTTEGLKAAQGSHSVFAQTAAEPEKRGGEKVRNFLKFVVGWKQRIHGLRGLPARREESGRRI